MLPHFNSRPHGFNNNNNNNIQINGASASAPQVPQQVMGNQANLCPNPAQIRPQFPMGMFNNPQLAMMNPNLYFAPGQFFPFPQGSFLNLNTDLAHIFARNSMNQTQFLPNGLPNLAQIQNINQLLQMQMPNCGPNNSGPSVNAQLGVNNGNGPLHQSVDGKGDFVPSQTQHNQIVSSPGAPNSQSNSGKFNGMNDRKNSWKKSHNTNFMNHKHNASQRGFGKQFHHQQNAQGNKFNNEHHAKGNRNNALKNLNFPNSSENIQGGQKRPLVLNYTEQEIQQWREQRRKNYPSNANLEKKLKEKSTQPEITDEAIKIRRQQLKEVLAKQAELGCEIAEIPSSYLSEFEQRPHGRQQNSKVFGRRDRFQNRFNSKGRFNQNDRFPKRQRTETHYPTNQQNESDHFTNHQISTNSYSTNSHKDNKREPSLLKKLLSSDIKRDKKHLLQVFRFMAMNSFFQNSGKALKFPQVIVRESEEESNNPRTNCGGDSNSRSGKEGCVVSQEEGEIPQADNEVIE